jgi:hypothetical protein
MRCHAAASSILARSFAQLEHTNSMKTGRAPRTFQDLIFTLQ